MSGKDDYTDSAPPLGFGEEWADSILGIDPKEIGSKEVPVYTDIQLYAVPTGDEFGNTRWDWSYLSNFGGEDQYWYPATEQMTKGLPPPGPGDDWSWRSMPVRYQSGTKTEYFNKKTGETVPYSPESNKVDVLTAQILKQGMYDKWTGEGNGSIFANARAMAGHLANAGITRLEDFGVRPQYAKAELGYYTLNGQQVFGENFDSVSTGNSYFDGEGYVAEMRKLTPEEKAQVKPVYGTYSWDDQVGYGFQPRNDIVMKDGVAMYPVGREYYNKQTGAPIRDRTYVDRAEDVWSGTSAGDGRTFYGVHFNEFGMPIFYTRYGGDTSDWGSVAPLLMMASFIPGVAPFAQAALAVGNAYNGNYTGAFLSALGAASSFGAQYSTIDPSSVNAVNGMDLASDVAAGVTTTSMVTTAANWLAENAGNIRTAQQAVGLLNALDKQNVAGIINSLVNISPQIGVTIPADLIKPINLAAVASAASKGDWTGALDAAQLLTNNPTLRQDLRLAESAARLAGAIKSDNPMAVLSSFMDLARTHNLGVGTVQQAGKNLGMPMSTQTATQMLESGDLDQHVKEYNSLLNQVKTSYRNNFGEEPTLDILSSFAGNGGLLEGYNAYIEDMQTTSQSEIEGLLKKAGLTTRDLNPEQVFQALSLSERSATRYINNLVEIRQNSFDGSSFGSKEEAAAEAIKKGFNTFTAPDGEVYNVIPGQVAKKIATDVIQGKNVGIDVSKMQNLAGDFILDSAGRILNMEDDIPEVVITATKLSKPSPSDAEAWKAYQDELRALGGASFSKTFTDQLDILTEAFKGTKPGTTADAIKNALSFGARNFGSLSANLLRGAEAFGLEKNSAALRVSQALERWGKTNQSTGVLDAEKRFVDSINGITKESLAAKLGTTPDKVSSFQVAAEQMRELGRQVVNNPLGTFSVGLGEAIQEVPFLVVSGGVGSVAAKVMSKAGAFAVARGTDAALNGFESFSGNYAEVKDYLTKNGYSDKAAEARAVASGLEAMGVTMLTSWVGDKAIVRAFMGDVASISASRIAGAGAKEYVMGYVEGGLQNASAQIGKYGEIRNVAEITAAGTIEGFIQSGLTTGVLSSEKLSQVVARDYDGKGVTLGSILDGTSTFDPGSMNSNFELTSGFTIGDAVNYNKTFAENPNITPIEYMKTAEFFRSEGLEPTPQNIAEVVGGETEITGDDLKAKATEYADRNVVTKDEATKMLADLGFKNPTEQQINQFVGNRVEADVPALAQSWVNQNTVTAEEARQQLKDIGYEDPPQRMVDALVGQYDQNQLADKANQFKLATVSDIQNALANLQIPSGVSKEDVTNAISDYMRDNPGVTVKDLDDAISKSVSDLATRSDLSALRNDLSKEIQAARDLGLEGDAALQSAIDKVATDLGVTRADVLAQLGKTESQLRTDFATQLGEVQTQLGNVQEALETAIADVKAAGLEGDAALQSSLEKVANDLGITKADILSQLGKTEEQLRTEFGVGISALEAQTKAQYDALSAEQKALADSLREQGVSLADAINQAKSAISADVQAKYDALTTEQRALADQLRQQGVDFNTAIETVRAQTQEQIGGLSADLQAKYDALTTEQKALANQLRQQGIDTAVAIEQARTAMSAEMQAKYDALSAEQRLLADNLAQQGIDLRTAIDVAAQQTQQQITDLGETLNQRVDELMRQGMDQFSATQKAIAEVTQQNQQLQGLVGTQARPANQADIDALSQMLSGQRPVDLTYDVNNDKQITQDDLNFLQNVIGGTNPDWRAPVGTIWGGTGLYGQLRQADLVRQNEIEQARIQREQDLEAQRIQREQDLEAQRQREAEAQRIAQIRSTAGMAGAQAQQIMQQLPQVARGMQTTTTPIYAGEMTPFDLGSPLDVDFFKPSKEKQGSQTGQQPTKIATGGYLDDLLDLLR